MNTRIKNVAKKAEQATHSRRTAFAEHLWKESWTYIKTVVDTAQESFLILDKECRVMAGNESFYRKFQVLPEDTEGKIIYELGNGEWNIPALRTLLEDILPNHSFFKGFEVTHEFPVIGRRVVLLNSRQIHFREDPTEEAFQPIILFAIEDVTEMMATAEKFAGHVNRSEAKMTARMGQMEGYLSALQKEISEFKKDA
ncbi:MAG: PAS domain-containing protein [bacterium]|nr:PAS domain-containing protein [bacterium]